MKASEIMTPSPSVCSSTDSLSDVARVMRDSDCGAVPIVDNGRVVGIVTDRDLAIRAVANSKSADTKVADVMTPSPQCCSADDDIKDVEKLMASQQVRRIPIVDTDGSCVGIISQADLAMAISKSAPVTEREVAIVVEAISKPSSSAEGADHRI